MIAPLRKIANLALLSDIKYCEEEVFYTCMSAAGFIKAVTGKCLSDKRHGTFSTFFETKSSLGSRLDSYGFQRTNLPKIWGVRSWLHIEVIVRVELPSELQLQSFEVCIKFRVPSNFFLSHTPAPVSIVCLRELMTVFFSRRSPFTCISCYCTLWPLLPM